MRTILIVENDETLREGLRIALEREGYRVLASNGDENLPELVRAERPSLLLLDVVLDRINGFEVCRQMRWQALDVPIIMMSAAKVEEIDRVVGLETGADDYLVKPFGIRELIARVAACLRRYPDPSAGTAVCSFDDVEVNFSRRTVSRAGLPVNLTSKELDLLQCLIKRRGHVVSREELLDRVWGYTEYPTTRTVDMHILALRRKLEADPSNPKHLLTVYREGYRFL